MLFYYFLDFKDKNLKSVRSSTKIRFIEDSDLEDNQHLMRVPTPHPKTMRAFAKMLLEKKKKSVIIFFNYFFFCVKYCLNYI